jgi:hypothetical protein
LLSHGPARLGDLGEKDPERGVVGIRRRGPGVNVRDRVLKGLGSDPSPTRKFLSPVEYLRAMFVSSFFFTAEIEEDAEKGFFGSFSAL